MLFWRRLRGWNEAGCWGGGDDLTSFAVLSWQAFPSLGPLGVVHTHHTFLGTAQGAAG